MVDAHAPPGHAGAMAAGKTALLTGATDGIGIPTAIGLAQRGFGLVLHGRKDERLAAARRAVLEAVPGARVETARADLASLAEVRAMALDLRARLPAIHALVLNAGVFAKDGERSRDGYELSVAVNHLAHFALATGVLDLVRAAAQRDGHGRVVTVSSIAHRNAELDLDGLAAGGRSTGYEAYAESKLLNVLFAAELARRETAAKTGVTSNSLHPGVLSTKLLRIGFGRGGAPVEEGARTSLFLAADPGVGQVTGRYFVGTRPADHHPAADAPALLARAWAVSEALVAKALGAG